VDTPGADPGFETEYSGLAASIGDTFVASLDAKVPVISAVVGEGGSGGALAIACGDVVGIQTHAVFSVIAPEGAAEILYRDASRAGEIAPLLRPTSTDLTRLGLADEVIPEPEGGAHTDPQAAAAMLKDWLMMHIDSTPNIENRRTRFRL
ncbi:MAG: carboxyl transferase domain-containing protein, partial [Acidimicrobiia bacterium]